MLALLLLLCAQDDPPGDDHDAQMDAALVAHASEQLIQAEQLIIDQLTVVRPWTALPRSRAATEGEILGLDGDALGAWQDALKTAQVALLELDSGVLPADRQQDVLTLEGWVIRELQVMAARKPLETDPLYYIEGIEKALRMLVPIDPTEIELSTYVALTERLEDIPDVLLLARGRLDAWVPALWSEDASIAAIGLTGFLAREGHSLARLANAGKPERERFDRARGEAMNALRDFGSWLVENRRNNLRRPPVLPKGSYEMLLENTFGKACTTSELELALLIAISERASRLGELPDIEKVREQFDVELAARAAKYFMNLIGATAVKIDGFSKLRSRIDIGLRQNSSPLSAVISVRRAGLDHWELQLECPDSSWPTEAYNTRLAALDPSGIRVLVLREGPVGAGLLRITAATHPSLTRTRLPNELREQAFGMYVAHRAAVLGFVSADDPRYAVALARSELIEAARALATLELHAKHMEATLVADRFATFTGYDGLSARLEISRAARDPLHGGAFLALLQTLDLERQLAVETSSEAPADERDAVLRALWVLLENPSARLGDL